MPFSAGPGADDAFDYLFKIILIGDSNVGKTCVVHRFKTGHFNEKQQNTIGVDFTVRSLDIDGKRVKVGGRNSGGAARPGGGLGAARCPRLPCPIGFRAGALGERQEHPASWPAVARQNTICLTGGLLRGSFPSGYPGGTVALTGVRPCSHVLSGLSR